MILNDDLLTEDIDLEEAGFEIPEVEEQTEFVSGSIDEEITSDVLLASDELEEVLFEDGILTDEEVSPDEEYIPDENTLTDIDGEQISDFAEYADGDILEDGFFTEEMEEMDAEDASSVLLADNSLLDLSIEETILDEETEKEEDGSALLFDEGGEGNEDTVTITYDAGAHGYFKYDALGNEYPEGISSKTETYPRGDYVSTPWPEPIANGEYILRGWSTEENAEEPLQLQSDEYSAGYYFLAETDVTLYAVWGEAVTVTFEAGAHGSFEYDEYGNKYETKVSSKEVKFARGDCVYGPPIDPTPNEGYRLLGWSLDEDAQEPDAQFEENGNRYFLADTAVTLYAVWCDEYKVTYHLPEGFSFVEEIYDEEIGDYVERESSEVTIGLPAGSLIDPGEVSDYIDSFYISKDEDYYIEGWSLKEDSDAEEDMEYSFELYEDIDLYAVYEEYVQVTWDANGGQLTDYESVMASYSQKRRKGSMQNLLDPDMDIGEAGELIPPEGMVFLGWGEDPDSKEILKWDDEIDGYYTLDSDKTFYAVYETGVKVIWDANGGSFTSYEYADAAVDGRSY